MRKCVQFIASMGVYKVQCEIFTDCTELPSNQSKPQNNSLPKQINGKSAIVNYKETRMV